jgi:hypothetical protein
VVAQLPITTGVAALAVLPPSKLLVTTTKVTAKAAASLRASRCILCPPSYWPVAFTS